MLYFVAEITTATTKSSSGEFIRVCCLTSVFSLLRQLLTRHCSHLLLSTICCWAPCRGVAAAGGRWPPMSIDISSLIALSSKPAARCGCGRTTRQTDRRTLGCLVNPPAAHAMWVMSTSQKDHSPTFCWGYLTSIHSGGLKIDLRHTISLPSVLWRCWLGGRKGIRTVKKLSGGVGWSMC